MVKPLRYGGYTSQPKPVRTVGPCALRGDTLSTGNSPQTNTQTMAQTTFANPETLVNNIAEVRSTMKELKEVDKQLTDRLRVWATENHEFFKDGKLDFEKGTIHFNSKPKLQVPQSFKDQLIMLDLAEESPALVKVSLNETEIMHLLNTNLNPALAGYLTEEGFAVIPDGKENFRINTK